VVSLQQFSTCELRSFPQFVLPQNRKLRVQIPLEVKMISRVEFGARCRVKIEFACVMFFSLTSHAKNQLIIWKQSSLALCIWHGERVGAAFPIPSRVLVAKGVLYSDGVDGYTPCSARCLCFCIYHGLCCRYVPAAHIHAKRDGSREAPLLQY